MRQRLLNATVECLAEVGFASTSTALISRRAGVSRGAQLHHFRSKEDLMLAAIEHVFEVRRAAFRQAMSRVPAGRGRLAAAVDHMWRTVNGPPTQAWLELVIAARTTPTLSAKVVQTTERLRRAARDELAELGIEAIPEPALQLVSALMDGLVVQQMAGLGDAQRDRILALLRQLTTLIGALV